MSDSYIDVGPQGVDAFVGPDATNLFRAISLKSGLLMWSKHKMMLTRGLTVTKLLAMATAYTGKTYKTKQAAEAAEDMTIWIEAMKSALPIHRRG